MKCSVEREGVGAVRAMWTAQYRRNRQHQRQTEQTRIAHHHL